MHRTDLACKKSNFFKEVLQLRAIWTQLLLPPGSYSTLAEARDRSEMGKLSASVPTPSQVLLSQSQIMVMLTFPSMSWATGLGPEGRTHCQLSMNV